MSESDSTRLKKAAINHRMRYQSCRHTARLAKQTAQVACGSSPSGVGPGATSSFKNQMRKKTAYIKNG